MHTPVVFIDRKAQKQLDRLPENIQNKVINAIDILHEEGFSKKLNIKKLRGLPNSFRIRVGTYRILFQLSSQNIIEIYAILPRKTAYN
ncbi:MAG: type II toxin-antitoxin system RelE/ParE family toxin [Candidatus Bathyarchaeota archaeon]|nr:type II toxin-antitoxin system RelE/ParE family toxin [Candidatus Bathyarchaeota archaeon]